MLVLAGGLWGLSTIGPGAEVWDVALWLAVMGLGTGLFISPNSSSLMGAAPRSHQGVAGGVLAVARNLGMLLGIAIAVTVFRSAGGRTGHHWTETDFAALRVALWVAAGASLLGGVVAAFRGRSEKSQGVKDSGSRGRTSG
jgi:MFS family permease